MSSEHELFWLLGARITKIEEGSIGTELTMILGEPVEIEGKRVKNVKFEVWRDEEGNGPGYLALVRAK
jgi:hypothetical protein